MEKLTLKSLASEIDSLKLVVASLKPVLQEEPKVEVSVPVPDYPMPAEYKEVVEVTLNKSFKARLEPMKDMPAVLFTIVVPKKYSKVTSGEDLRPKVVTYADGVQGVRLWAERVLANFDKDTQELIVQDRPFVESPI